LEHAAVQPVDRLVHLGEPTCEVEVEARERVHRRRDHPQRDRAHLLEVLEDLGALRQAARELGDLRQVHRLVGDALEVEVDVQEHGEEP